MTFADRSIERKEEHPRAILQQEVGEDRVVLIHRPPVLELVAPVPFPVRHEILSSEHGHVVLSGPGQGPLNRRISV